MASTSGLRDPAKYPSLVFEKDLWDTGFSRVAGIDEAGRGAWAGPVCAAAVILPPDPAVLDILDQVRDSKLMTPLARAAWAPRIQAAALFWGVGFASSQEIDLLGILPATKLAATRALDSLSSNPSSLRSTSHVATPAGSAAVSVTPVPDFLLTDLLVFPNIELPQTALVKGDRLSLSVAAASVLAKTARDASMQAAEIKYPGYGFGRHKGYGTAFHQQAIRQIGLCEIHRKSFSFL
jgi:ribonuclease HII